MKRILFFSILIAWVGFGQAGCSEDASSSAVSAEGDETSDAEATDGSGEDDAGDESGSEDTDTAGDGNGGESGETPEGGEAEETAVECPPLSIGGIASTTDDFSTLMAAVTAADMVETLCNDGEFTVFAPTNAAFDALPEGVLDAVLADPDTLKDVLLYHVTSGRVLAEEVVTLDSVNMLNGGVVTVEVVDGGVILNGSVNITTTDIEADNGVIHVIDAVLVPVEGEEEGGETVECPPNSIAGIAAASDDFSTLTTAVEVAGLRETLCNQGEFTVFAPTNAAFDALPDGLLEAVLADADLLGSVLRYHLVAGKVLAEEVVTLDSVDTLAGLPISVEVTPTGVVLNGTVNVTATDILADNGVIHVIDAVLLPPEGGEEGGESVVDCPANSIAGIASASDDFSTLVTALEVADLTETFCNEGDFTVFAPTNAAFDALDPDTLNALLADVEALGAILRYHVASGTLLAEDVIAVTEIETLSGEVVSVEFTDAGVILNGTAKVVTTDILADNGVIHVIDAVLLPPTSGEEGGESSEEGGGCPADSIAGIASADPSFSTLVTALSAADLVDTFCNDGDFTVFAPTNNAFAGLPDGLLQSVLADEALLNAILTYHVASGTVLASEVVTLSEVPTLNGAVIEVEVIDGGVVLNGTVNVIVTDMIASNGVIHVIDAVLLPPTPPEGGLCAGSCGGASSQADCQCDELCDQFGDCCEGVCDDCSELGFCQPEPECDPGSISGIASANENLTTLVTALDQANLVQTFCDPGDYTVFAPTNAAFDALGDTLNDVLADANLLNSILTYHVVGESLLSGSLLQLDSVTTLNGDDIEIEFAGGALILNGEAEVVISNIEASNGVVHVIDAVLIPGTEPTSGLCEGFCGGQSATGCWCDELCNQFGDCCSDVCTYCGFWDFCGGTGDPCPSGSITGQVSQLPEFSTLKTALEVASLTQTFCDPGDYTVFAPTNSAFDALGGTLDVVLSDQDLLTSILTYHVLDESLSAAEVVTQSALTTLNGKDIQVAVTAGGVVLNDSVNVTVTDIDASNGVIHVIDAVLLPPEDPDPTCPPGSIGGIATADGNFTILLAALDAADLTETFCTQGDFTVLAPTDAAFTAFFATSGLDPDTVLGDQDLLNSVLTYHVAVGAVPASQVVTLPFIPTLNGAGVKVDVVNGGVVLNGTVNVTSADIVASNGIIHVIDGVLLPPEEGDTLNLGEECWNEAKECGVGTTCTFNGDSSEAYCYPDLAEGAPCGPGLGLCGEDVSCAFDDASEATSSCYPDVGKGAFCNNIAEGGCPTDYSCIAASATPPFVFFCFSDEVDGDACGPGKGLCLDGSSCVFAFGPTGVCTPDQGEGQSCGGGDQGLCGEALSCVNGTCQETLLNGGACGADVGTCADGLSCSQGTCQQ